MISELLADLVGGSEKAGGGSIPSLATTFSITYSYIVRVVFKVNVAGLFPGVRLSGLVQVVQEPWTVK